MRFSILQDQFAAALSTVIKAVPTKTSLPVLANVYLYTEDARLYIVGTDLELSVRTWIGCKVDVHGHICLPAKTLVDLVKNLAPERVDVSVNMENFKATIKCGTTKTNVNGMNGDEYPNLPEIGTPEMVLPGALLKSKLQKVMFSAAHEQSRPILTGVCFDFEPTSLTLAAADGYRLATNCIELEAAEARTMIVPVRALEKLVSVIDEDEEVGIYTFRTQNGYNIMFMVGNVVISMWLLEGKFPDFRAILPKSSQTQVIANTEDLTNAAKRGEIFARDSNHSIRMFACPSDMESQPGTVMLRGVSAERGDAETMLDAEMYGVNQEIAFNVQYLVQILNATGGEQVRLELNGSGAPLDITDGDTHWIIMPMSNQR